MSDSRNDFDETRDLSALFEQAGQLQDPPAQAADPAADAPANSIGDDIEATAAVQTPAAGIAPASWGDEDEVVAPAPEAPATQAMDPVVPPPVPPVEGGAEDSGEGGGKPAKKRRVGLMVTGLAVLAILAAAGGYGGYYGAGHRALPGTTVGDVSVSGMTRAEIVKAVDRAAADAKLSVTGDKVKAKTASISEMGVKVDAAKAATDALKRNSSIGAYFTAPFTTNRIEPQVTSDSAKLAAFSQSLTEGVEGTFAATEPSVAPNPEKTEFVAVPGKDGQGVPVTDLLNHAKKAVAAAKTLSYRATLGPIAPQLDIKTAQKRADEANALVKPQIAVKVGDETVSPEPAMRVAWVNVPDAGAKDEPTLKADDIKAWTHKIGDKLAVKKIDGERYKNENGDVVRVKREAKDGVEVTNIDQVAQQIVTDIQAKKAYNGAIETKPIQAQWKEKVIAAGAENLPYPAAPGEKWIDVDLGRHLTTAYEGATVVHGPLEMVPGGPRTPTVTGTFHIERKYRTKTMRGDNLDGSRYEIEGVPYAMYFHQGYALHGAPWRSNFSYEAMGPGSHGCINLPVSESKWFFGWAPMGTPVVSHY